MLEQRLRHYCRNPRCRTRLKEPVENPRAAFCSEACCTGFYRLYCIVCEELFERASSTQKLCGRRKCRREFDRDPSRFFSPLGGNLKSAESSRKNSTKSKRFGAVKSRREFGWKAAGEQYHLIDRDGRIVARLAPEDTGWWIARPRTFPELPIYPTLDAAKRAAVNVALWALPPDPKTAARQRKQNAIPQIDPQSRNPAPPVAFMSSMWRPGTSINAADTPEIPEFLRRGDES
jgi:hypothetical protein